MQYNTHTYYVLPGAAMGQLGGWIERKGSASLWLFPSRRRCHITRLPRLIWRYWHISRTPVSNEHIDELDRSWQRCVILCDWLRVCLRRCGQIPIIQTHSLVPKCLLGYIALACTSLAPRRKLKSPSHCWDMPASGG